MNAKDLALKLKPVFETHNVVFAYLFGSYATNEASKVSDIDIAVYIKDVNDVNNESLFSKKLSIHIAICRALKINNVDIVVLNNAHNLMLIDEIIRNGIVIFDVDSSSREEYEISIIHKAIDFKTQRLMNIGL